MTTLIETIEAPTGEVAGRRQRELIAAVIERRKTLHLTTTEAEREIGLCNAHLWHMENKPSQKYGGMGEAVEAKLTAWMQTTQSRAYPNGPRSEPEPFDVPGVCTELGEMLAT